MARQDGRYKLEAYLFVIESLGFQMRKLKINTPEKRRHLTARELLEGIRDLAWDRYGRLAGQIFQDWGVKTTLDFGEIVFNLIEIGEFSKTEEDKKEDFAGVFDFKKDLFNAYPIGDRIRKK